MLRIDTYGHLATEIMRKAITSYEPPVESQETETTKVK
jgi:hypothetical protein